MDNEVVCLVFMERTNGDIRNRGGGCLRVDGSLDTKSIAVKEKKRRSLELQNTFRRHESRSTAVE